MTHANDLNSVAASILKVGVEMPVFHGTSLTKDMKHWGSELLTRLRTRLASFFVLLDKSDNNTYIFARTVACPRTGKPVLLVGDWSLRRGKKPVAVRVVTQRGGVVLDEPEFDLAEGAEIDFDPKRMATWSRGKGVSHWDHLTIDSAYIKAEAQAGRMGEILYAVAVRASEGRGFRVPTSVDLDALAAAGGSSRFGRSGAAGQHIVGAAVASPCVQQIRSPLPSRSGSPGQQTRELADAAV